MQLLVNVDHIATLRNARGEGYPDPVEGARICEEAGAAGIVFHLRSDRRHIRDKDVNRLKESVKGVLDFEMAATDEMLRISRETDPDLVTLVPESREELTTEGGLDMGAVFDDFRDRVFPVYRETDIAISLFVDPVTDDIERSAELGSDAIELHTGTYANAADSAVRERELERLKEAAELAHRLGMKVNAGHGLNLENLEGLVRNVPHLNDISIGHALVSDALFMGLAPAVEAYLAIMRKAETPAESNSQRNG